MLEIRRFPEGKPAISGNVGTVSGADPELSRRDLPEDTTTGQDVGIARVGSTFHTGGCRRLSDVAALIVVRSPAGHST